MATQRGILKGAWRICAVILTGLLGCASPVLADRPADSVLAAGGPVLSTTWQGISTGAPSPRAMLTAVWTGSSMIVWGGDAGIVPVYDNLFSNNGGMYNPVANQWKRFSWNGTGVRNHTAVWTGSSMIIWGGDAGRSKNNPAKEIFVNTGEAYRPGTDQWMVLSTTGAPAERSDHTAVWTGSDMIVWGGSKIEDWGIYYNDGGSYNLATNKWKPLPAVGAPSARTMHTAIWTGTEMIIWGGWNGSTTLGDGARYNPATKVWKPLPASGAPSARSRHTVIWTGTEMIIWGGWSGSTPLSSGARYNPATNKWTPLSTYAAPSPRFDHTSVWTGSEMIVWGGISGSWSGYFSTNGDANIAGTTWNDGARYNPATNTWTPINISGAPAARYSQVAVWSGSEMIVWGGLGGREYNNGTFLLNDGSRYNPTTDQWTSFPSANLPTPRKWHTAVGTGADMIIWGGSDSIRALNSGAIYHLYTNLWDPLPLTGAPSARYQHTALWNGTEMLIWGGWDGINIFNTGARYNPAANQWSPTADIDPPSARFDHSAIWTGSGAANGDGEMIIWGGGDGHANVNTGARYDPSANTWTPTARDGAPSARSRHAAVWTGSEMIIWGGGNGSSFLSNGARYNPAADTWSPLSTLNAPTALIPYSVVWTGTEMIVWGVSDNGALKDGGRYNPATDTWTHIGASFGPYGLYPYETATWTGSEMILMGGYESFWENSIMNPPIRYNPANDTWALLPDSDTLYYRTGYSAVWTGGQFIVWAGYDVKRGAFAGDFPNDGARLVSYYSWYLPMMSNEQ